MFFTPSNSSKSIKKEKRKKNDIVYVNMLAEINDNLEQVYGLLESPILRKLRQGIDDNDNKVVDEYNSDDDDDAEDVNKIREENLSNVNFNSTNEVTKILNNRLHNIENILLLNSKSVENKSNTSKDINTLLKTQKEYFDEAMRKMSSLEMLLPNIQLESTKFVNIESKIFATYKIVEAMHLLIQDNLKIQEKLYDSIINMSKNNRNNQSVLEHHDADNAMVKKFNEVEEVVHSIKQIMEKLHMLHESNSKKQEKILLLHAESNSNYKTNHFEKIVNLENKFDTLNVDTRNNNVKFHNRFNDLENKLLDAIHVIQKGQKADSSEKVSSSKHSESKSEFIYNDNNSNNNNCNKVMLSELHERFNSIEKMISFTEDTSNNFTNKSSNAGNGADNGNVHRLKLATKIHERFDAIEKIILSLSGNTISNLNQNNSTSDKALEDIRNIIEKNFEKNADTISRLEQVQNQNSSKFNWFLFIQTILFISYFSSFWLHSLQVGIHDYSRSL